MCVGVWVFYLRARITGKFVFARVYTSNARTHARTHTHTHNTHTHICATTHRPAGARTHRLKACSCGPACLRACAHARLRATQCLCVSDCMRVHTHTCSCFCVCSRVSKLICMCKCGDVFGIFVFSRYRSLTSSLTCSHSLCLSPSIPPSFPLPPFPTLPFTLNMRACVVQAVIGVWQTQRHTLDKDRQTCACV